MSRGLHVERLIFGILPCVATDIKMLRSKLLAKMVSRLNMHTKTQVLFAIYYSSVFMYLHIFTKNKFVQIHFFYSRKVQMRLYLYVCHQVPPKRRM